MCTVSGSEFMDSFPNGHVFIIWNLTTAFTNTDLCSLKLLDVRSRICDFSNADLSPKASIHRAEFINCKLLGTSLPESAIHHVTFQDCILNLATFGFSKLENIDSLCSFTQLQRNRFLSMQIQTSCFLIHAI